ncbi:type III secretion system outer membrane ring subunit SctC [Rugamonas sp. CCM 8940]|uniref:type III secretion system outer membrane ring subunit SctC n=1 Tax=Rugamonas sp. CCM 8940 TaxID=2765359 RepID=UPI0018F77EBC|nr:type III secretion system outer membrane ring subunit SctC [Rugamonas sp. CCM 8940]MBJ7311932.1 type III secretion system outer membrane ring subunit SctC [Rugamonas sp. CCM 8940]
MSHASLRRRLGAALAAALLLCGGPGRAATPAGWKDSGFAINANGMKLHEVLEEFGRVYGVRLAVSANGAAIVKGKLKADSGADFLDHMMQQYRFRWFVYNDTLYVVPRDENSSKRLEIGEDAVQDAKEALIGLGLFDSRFGWGELPDEGTVIVSGPRAYVNLVREVLLPEEGKAHLKGKQIMVFRLKYASATDRVITSRGQAETIPGVKTILNNLLYGAGSGEKLADTRGGRYDVASGKRSRQEKGGRGVAREVGNSLLASAERTQRDNPRGPRDGDEGEPERERPGRGKAAPAEDKARIEADPSLNAIMIYDNINKQEMYKGLIAQLDIEPQQIEIEALIVDIERNKLAELGAEWGVRSGNVVSTINSTGADSKGIDLPIPGATLLISNAARFYARLKALESDGQARVLAKPTVLTLDNVAAVLDLNQTAYVPLVGERVADLANVTAGTMLRVVPRIVREGDTTRVRLEVDIEDGTLGDVALKSNVTRSTISTQAIIDLQHTLMIGGYHAESVSSSLQKTPLLGDIPLFGGLFRSEKTAHSSRERLFLITPRLSGTTGAATALARSRAAKLARRVALEDQRGADGLVQDKAGKEKVAQDKVTQDKLAKAAALEQAAQEKAAQEKVAQEKLAQEKAAQEKAAQEKVAQEKLAQEKAAQEKAAQEKVAQEKLAQEKAAQEKAAQEKAAQVAAQEKLAQEKLTQEKAAQEKPAREQAASAGSPDVVSISATTAAQIAKLAAGSTPLLLKGGAASRVPKAKCSKPKPVWPPNILF